MWQIFARDVRRLVKNPIALIIIVGVLFLPSVYAWLTIGADWDPYGETQNLKVAFANADTGAENSLTGEINIGNAVEAKLRDDHHLGWQFVGEEQAKQGVWSGEYYAAIVIPTEFSRDFLSVLSGDFSKPTIDYYVNEKVSAVAPELTNSGANTVQNEINAQFVETVSKTVVDLAQKAGGAIEQDAKQAEGNLTSDIHTMRRDVTQVSEMLGGLDTTLDSAEQTVAEAKQIIAGLQGKLPQLTEEFAGAENRLKGLATNVQEFAPEVSKGLASASSELRNAADGLGEVIEVIKGKAEFSELVKELEEIEKQVAATAEQLGQVAGTFDEEIVPEMTGSLGQFAGVFGTLEGMTTSLAPILTSTQNALDQLTTTLELAKTAGASVQTALGALDQTLAMAETDLTALNDSASVQKMAEFLKMSPEQVGEFMAAPVTLKTETLYPIKNYGTGVAPFFTNIALWVAGFILVAILHIRVDPEGLPKFSVTEAYLGRLLLFLVLGVLQAIIVCSGDLIMGIQCANPFLYVFAGVVAVLTYVNIMYALVYTMRHIGRAIGVVILIMQIPGASGEYPVQMMPQFFQVIHPFLPFTYSIDAMREATGGLYGAQYWTDLLALVPFLVLALVFGLVVGRRAFNLNALFDKDLGETDLLITEDGAQVQKSYKLQTLIAALLESKTYRKMLTERLARFQRRYPAMIRTGWALLIILPIVTLILNAVLKTDADGKVILLLIMVIGIIAVVSYLVAVEYINYNLSHQLKYAKKPTKIVDASTISRGNRGRKLANLRTKASKNVRKGRK